MNSTVSFYVASYQHHSVDNKPPDTARCALAPAFLRVSPGCYCRHVTDRRCCDLCINVIAKGLTPLSMCWVFEGKHHLVAWLHRSVSLNPRPVTLATCELTKVLLAFRRNSSNDFLLFLSWAPYLITYSNLFRSDSQVTQKCFCLVLLMLCT